MLLDLSTQLFPDDRCRIVRMLAPRLREQLLPKLVEELESVSRGTGREMEERWRALIAIAARLSRLSDEDERNRILTVVLDEMVRRHWWQISEAAFVDLIPLLPLSLRSGAVSTAIRQCFGEYRLGDLEPLLSVLDGSELRLAFDELEGIADPHQKARALGAVLRRAGQVVDQSMMFRDLDVVGQLPPPCTRAEVLAIIGALGWWIRQQGGDKAVSATVDAVFDVTRWWR
jgi:hypothetical protein